MTILVLGGTSEARALARLLEGGPAFLSSLAGRVADPRLPVGRVRIGGFGGVAGLRAYLGDASVSAVVDATHPFAATISRNAAQACAAAQVPLLRLERAGWADNAGADQWHWVDDHGTAAATAAGLGTRPFLTVGRQSLPAFVGPLADHAALVRVVDAPDDRLPATWRLLRSRGPYRFEDELALLREHGTDVLVTKDSGGVHTHAKLDAASRLDVPVVVVRRPALPPVQTVSDAGAAAAWARARG